MRRLVIGPGRIATHIVDSVERGGGETTVPRYYAVAGIAQALCPNLLARILGRARNRSTIEL
jgi:hypothetical protein